jgi:hypothetical protein
MIDNLALNKQIHIYSVDTGCFYTPIEEKIHRCMIRYGRHKNELKKINTSAYDEDKRIKYKKLYSFVNKKIKDSKELLKEEFKNNTQNTRQLSENSFADKNVISVFESTLTRVIGIDIDQLSCDIMVVQTFFYEVIEQLIKNGFTHNGEKYKYFTSSAGQIRLKKTVFIKQSLWDKHEKTLMCGLTIDKINSTIVGEKINDDGSITSLFGINVNKFLAYLALSNSATDLWEDFNIDKCIVVKDFETKVIGEVDNICDVTYKIERQIMPVPITHTDGCGMILPKICKKNFMVRLPWVKGLLASFDFVRFIRENNCSSIVKDIYDKEWDILKDDIQIIFTESQFKMYKYYNDWDEYKYSFKEHKCQAGICNMEEDRFSKATINYQMIQTLTDIKKEEIEILISRSQQKLYNLSRDKSTMLNAFSVTKHNTDKTYLQQALEIYPELLQDEYCKHALRQIKNSLIKKYKSAKLDVFGKYTFLIPDLYAFCENLFMGIKEPNGLLGDGEVFCKLFKNSKKLDCLRSPHLYCEHAVKNNTIDKEKSKWFKTDAIYTSIYDLISKILMFDNDGDKALVVADENLIAVAERNVINKNVVPLYYQMKKAESTILNSDSIWEGLNAAFSGGNIGAYSNDISKIWNSDVFINGTKEEQQEALYVIKLLCMENNFVIDYAKTLYKPERPDDINTVIKKYTHSKIPYFFIYAKDKTSNQVSEINNSLVNSFDKMFKNNPLKFDIKNFGKLDYKKMMSDKNIVIDNDIIEEYNKLNRTYHFKISQKNQDNVDYIIKTIKDSLLSFGYIEVELSDMLVKHLYSMKKQPHKEVLWQCFGNVIINNLIRNIPENSIQCEKCGARFIQTYPNQKLCETCSTYQPLNNKSIKCIVCNFEVDVDAWDMKTCRCKKCQHIENKRIKLEYYHNNKKLKKS